LELVLSQPISEFIHRALTTSPAGAFILVRDMSLKHFLTLWSPRILGIAVSFVLSLFALDAFTSGRPVDRAVADFVMHLVPALAVLAVVMMAWRRPWMGGVTFVLLAAAYALAARSRLDWVLVISGPLLVVGLLFLWSWRSQQRLAG
jgi:hypothetical protein